jgi:hypothetical protein
MEKDAIDLAEIRTTVESGELVEVYPDTGRGESALLVGISHGRPIHVVCAPKSRALVIVTVYIPSAATWEADWKTRRK